MFAKTNLQYIFCIVMSFVIAACAGGGSTTSSTTSAATTNPFTNWSNAVIGSAVNFSNGTSAVLATNESYSQSSSEVSATLTNGASNTFTSINAAVAGNTASFSITNGDTLQSGFYGATTIALNKSQTTVGTFANPAAFGFEYQTFGAWGGYGNSTVPAAAVSVGSPSPGSAIPPVGSLTFTGGATGYYVDPGKFGYLTNANMVAVVTFDNRTVTFNTTNTTVTGGPGMALISTPNLNMTGNLSYAAGANALSGTASTSSGMTGNINGKFYGPGLNELGGTYVVTGSGLGSMVGGFGGKR